MGSHHPPLGCSGWPRPVPSGCCVWCSKSLASGVRAAAGGGGGWDHVLQPATLVHSPCGLGPGPWTC